MGEIPLGLGIYRPQVQEMAKCLLVDHISNLWWECLEEEDRNLLYDRLLRNNGPISSEGRYRALQCDECCEQEGHEYPKHVDHCEGK